MDATVRRYDGIDTTRSEEIIRKVDETLIPAPSELEGSSPTCGALASILLSERSAQGEESTRPVAEWVRGDEFESALPHPPAIPTRTGVAERSAEGALAGVV